MKIMHLISTDIFSGAENVACQIIDIFRNNNNYEMIYVSQKGENYVSLLERQVKYYQLQKFNYKNVKKAVKEIEPDIIHAHDAKSIVLASFFYKYARIIGHIHGNHENMRKLTAKTFLLNFISKRVEKIIWVSNSSVNDYYFNKNISNKSIVLYNVINYDKLIRKVTQDYNSYDFDLIFLGRLSYPKDPLRFLRVVKLVYDNNKDINVAIVGSGELDEKVKKSISDMCLEKCVTLYGFVNNPYKMLKCSKLMVMTSRYEGTPMAALEALCLGVPVIGTPTDGLKDIIINNENGFLSSSDQVLADKILEIINNPKKAKIMKDNAVIQGKKINDIEHYRIVLEELYEQKNQ